MTKATTPNGSDAVAKMTRVYLKIKAAREELSSEFNAKDKALGEQQDMIKHALLDYCKAEGVESVRTADGLFYRSVKTRYWASDWDSVYAFAQEHDMLEVFEKRLSQGVMKALADSGELPTGVSVDSEYVLTIKRK
jgi:Zn/Cd-binding protein ZinT